MKRATWVAYERPWHLACPSIDYLPDGPDEATIAALIDALLLYAIDSERGDLYAELIEDEDLDVDILQSMVASARSAIYDMPYATVLTLWDAFAKHRHLIHGRLIAGGNPKGTASLDLYDAACLGLAILDEQWSGIPGQTYDEKGRSDLFTQLGVGGKSVTESQLAELAALQEAQGFKPGQTSAPARRRPPTEPDGS